MHEMLKPKLTPEEARKDHRMMLRFIFTNTAIGVLIGVLTATAIILLDIGGIGTRIANSSNPLVPVFLIVVPFASIFGGAVTASAILLMPYERKYQREEKPPANLNT